MTDASAEPEEEEVKSSKLPLILGLVAALVGAGGGFFATFTGILFAPESPEMVEEEVEEAGPLPDVAFIAVDPIIVSLGGGADKQHLQFRAQLEVPTRHSEDVQTLLPRVIDVLNGYLRALEPSDIEAASALTRLRAQMLRRVQIVVGANRVNDLLIMEFVVN
ncbi:MAG: flagellar basal body-associated FliL family protein [Pseudomonadota bacterium]